MNVSEGIASIIFCISIAGCIFFSNMPELIMWHNLFVATAWGSLIYLLLFTTSSGEKPPD
jgi:hypothetical protein